MYVHEIDYDKKNNKSHKVAKKNKLNIQEGHISFVI